MLGNHLEANQELEQIPPELWTRPDVMEVRWHICAHAQNWDACLEIGKALVDLAPDHAPNWLLRAFALRRAMGAVSRLHGMPFCPLPGGLRPFT